MINSFEKCILCQYQVFNNGLRKQTHDNYVFIICHGYISKIEVPRDVRNSKGP